MLLPGPILWATYKYSIFDFVSKLDFCAHKMSFLLISATFSFTMLGFLSAILAGVLAMNDRPFIERYRSRGHLSDFLFFYNLCMLMLILTLILSLASFGKLTPKFIFEIAMMSFTNNIFHILSICIISYLITSRAAQKNEQPDTL